MEEFSTALLTRWQTMRQWSKKLLGSGTPSLMTFTWALGKVQFANGNLAGPFSRRKRLVRPPAVEDGRTGGIECNWCTAEKEPCVYQRNVRQKIVTQYILQLFADLMWKSLTPSPNQSSQLLLYLRSQTWMTWTSDVHLVPLHGWEDHALGGLSSTQNTLVPRL